MSDAKPQPPELWENVANLLQRVKVPGGWLYRTTDYSEGAPALAFVPFPPVEVMFAPPVGGGLA